MALKLKLMPIVIHLYGEKQLKKMRLSYKNLFIKIKNDIDIKIEIKLTKITVSNMEEMVILLEKYLEEHKVNIVNGKGHKKHKSQKYLELLKSDYIERQKKYNFANKIFNGRNSFSKTDFDATFMHMKEDHMKNG